MSAPRGLLSHNTSVGTVPTQANSVSLVGKYCFSSNMSTPFTGRYSTSDVTGRVLPRVKIKPIYFCVLLSYLVLSWSGDSSARQWGSDRRRWLCFSINTTSECIHCACDCKGADNWFKKIFFLLCLQSLEYDAISHLLSTTSPVTLKHFPQTFLAFFVQIELNENGCRRVSFLGNEDGVRLLL